MAVTAVEKENQTKPVWQSVWSVNEPDISVNYRWWIEGPQMYGSFNKNDSNKHNTQLMLHRWT